MSSECVVNVAIGKREYFDIVVGHVDGNYNDDSNCAFPYVLVIFWPGSNLRSRNSASVKPYLPLNNYEFNHFQV